MKTRRRSDRNRLLTDDKCLTTACHVSIDVNDVFDELYSENQELKEQIKLFSEFKRFVDQLMTRIRSTLSDTEVNRLDQLASELKTFIKSERQSSIISETQSEIKSEETSDVTSDEDIDVKPIRKRRRGRGRPPKVVEERSEWVCEYCQRRTPSQRSYIDHQFKHHGIGCPRRARYECEWPGCDVVLFKKARYKQHLNGHRGITYRCPVPGCTKQYKTRESLKHHSEASHKSRPVKCTVDGCPKTFPSAYYLKIHMRVHKRHSMERTAACPLAGCEYKAFDRHMLTRHILSHSDDRPFQCTVDGCGKAFKVKGELKVHTNNVHTEGQSHTCDVDGCDRVFRFKQTLARHKQRDHSDQVLRCAWPGCEYQTKLTHNLTKHGLVHLTALNYPCPWPGCVKSFKAQKYVSEHLKTHKAEKKYGCRWPGCVYRCYSASNVKKHEIQVHRASKDMFADRSLLVAEQSNGSGLVVQN